MLWKRRPHQWLSNGKANRRGTVRWLEPPGKCRVRVEREVRRDNEKGKKWDVACGELASDLKGIAGLRYSATKQTGISTAKGGRCRYRCIPGCFIGEGGSGVNFD